MKNKLKSEGFSLTGTITMIAVLIAIGASGIYVWHTQQDLKPVSKPTAITPAIDQYAGWQTYTDIGYPYASGASIKFPTGWGVNVGDSKAYAWELVQKTPPGLSINARVIYLSATMTPQQEWENCHSADACGPLPGDVKLESSSGTINKFDSYSTKMQSSTGTYYATVIKSDKTSSNGTAFLELVMASGDVASVDTYKKIVSTVAF